MTSAPINVRDTFVIESVTQLRDESLQHSKGRLNVKNVIAARQTRWTVPLEKLPWTIRSVLNEVESLHVNYGSHLRQRLPDPLSAVRPSGFHILLEAGREK